MKFAFAGLNLEPEDIRVKATLINRVGSVYDSLKIHDLAIKYYKETTEEDPKFSWPHTNLGTLYADQKRYTDAEEEYKRAIEIDPNLKPPRDNIKKLQALIKTN